jgi:hypothetical protein
MCSPKQGRQGQYNNISGFQEVAFEAQRVIVRMLSKKANVLIAKEDSAKVTSREVDTSEMEEYGVRPILHRRSKGNEQDFGFQGYFTFDGGTRESSSYNTNVH